VLDHHVETDAELHQVDDPDLEAVLERIYRDRGRPIVEEDE
jgi:hypothetical protein